MTTSPQLFHVDPATRASQPLEEVNFSSLGFLERRDIQEWVAANPAILGDGLLVVSKEFSGFDRTNERLDLLAVDTTGALVIIELKRDDSGSDAHWQAIKYASYLRDATPAFIAQRLANYEQIPTEEAAERLQEHLDASELTGLNYTQRIILASHRFSPEVTSAVLWLNDKLDNPLISCVTLTPFKDATTGALYVQANTIIPVPGADEYMVGVGKSAGPQGGGRSSNLAQRLREAFQRRKNDAVTDFARAVAKKARQALPAEMRPDRSSSFARGTDNVRHYDLWYGYEPWGRSRICHRITFRPTESPDSYLVHIRFFDKENSTLAARESIGTTRNELGLQEGQVLPEQVVVRDGAGVVERVGADTLSDTFAQRIAERWQWFIETLTPLVNEWYGSEADGNDPDENNDE